MENVLRQKLSGSERVGEWERTGGGGKKIKGAGGYLCLFCLKGGNPDGAEAEGHMKKHMMNIHM